MKDTIPTPEQVRRAIDTGICPRCGKDNVQAPTVPKLDIETIHHAQECPDCGAEWDEVYHLAAIRPCGADEAIYPPDAQAERIAALETALRDLFEHCAMTHNRWGDGCNRTEATAAIARARALIA